MPASRRHHRVLAVFVHCLGVLAAVPALPATAPRAAAAPAHAAPAPAAPATPAQATPAAPAPAAPSGPPAVPSTPVPLRPLPSPVTVAVAPASTPAPAYQIQVRNATSTPVDTTVRQAVPPGSSATIVTAGGRASRPTGPAAASEVTWRLKLPARSSTTLNTALKMTAPGRPVTAPACAYGIDGTRPYDCGTATWKAAGPAPVAKVTGAPAWRRPPVLLGAFAAFLVITGGALWWWRQRRRRSAVAPAVAATAGGSPMAGGAGGPGGPGTVYPRRAMPPSAGRRRTPPVWLVVGVAAVVVAGVVGTATWTATRRAASIDTKQQPTSGAWTGKTVSGSVGVPLRESAFEFTVYRVACAMAGQPIGTTGGRQCQATVGVRNLTPEEQSWHGQLQRAYLPGGNWVSTDENATRVANLGRDVFAAPVAAGSRVVLPLVFTLNGAQPPKQLELRSGVFSAGVRVDVP
ncbi:hypothetical protein GA0070624_2227 [Micromonospora rhizosphaerae]|uniref:DUF4352 domain-containing protein n=1 Tax=Micromonospora rhizosphaerae TaxID=568872 RepID=A0A1C6RVM4_9ACTN|nr:hypothetical protein [Micromonospora rhizosphaerae]SCL21109.1 hypothetical protein GA0070624_2227 [Micromonospora rhizosphaerae]